LSLKVPHIFNPKTIHNGNNYLISLGKLSVWMAERAIQMGIEILTGTPAAEVLYDANGALRGIATGDFGIAKKKEISKITFSVKHLDRSKTNTRY
jgi:electron-transferring-flavoprotein dehydrogenase